MEGKGCIYVYIDIYKLILLYYNGHFIHKYLQ
jgi:hypothetical protein